MAYLSSEEAKNLGLDDGGDTSRSGHIDPKQATALGLNTGAPKDNPVPEWGRKYPNLYGVAGAAVDTLSPVVEALGAAGGSVVGAGSGIITGPGAIVTGIAGAGLGYAGARQLTSSARQALGTEKGKTIPEAAVQAIQDVPVGMAMEAGGQVAGKGITLGLQHISNALSKIKPINIIGSKYRSALRNNPYAAEGDKIARETGIDLTPAQVTGNKFLTYAENAARQAGVTADQVRAQDIKTAQQAINRIETVMDKMSKGGKSTETMGLDLQMAVKNSVNSIREMRKQGATVDYGTVRLLAGDKPIVPVNNITKELDSIISDYDIPGAEAQKIVTQAKAMLKQIESGSKVNIDKAMKMRSVYSEASHGSGNIFSDLDRPTSRKLAVRLMEAVGKDIDAAPSTIGGEKIGEALRLANRNYSAYSESISAVEDSVLGRMIGQDVNNPMSGMSWNTVAPEVAAGRLLKMHPSELRVAKEILERNAPDTWNSVKRYVLEQSLETGMKIPPSAGMNPIPISGNKFVSSLPKDANMKTFFEPRELEQINQIKSALIRMGDRTGTNTSNTEVMRQFMEMINSWSVKGLIKAGGRVVGLKSIANAMTTEEGRQALLALTQKTVNPQKTINAARILIYGYGIDKNDEARQEQKSGDGIVSKMTSAEELPQRADGGPVASGQPYVVGELGPEVFVPGQSGQIMPNESLQAMRGTPVAPGMQTGVQPKRSPSSFRWDSALKQLIPFMPSEAEASPLSDYAARNKALAEAEYGGNVVDMPQARTASAPATASQPQYQAKPNLRQADNGVQMFVDGDFDSKWLTLNDDEVSTIKKFGRLSPAQLTNLKKRGGI